MQKLLLFTIVIFLLSSCSHNYYQMCEVASADQEQPLYYENQDCVITYDFWSENGNPGFTVRNKTNEILKIDLEKCFYVKNGVAQDYYQNRSYSSSKSFVLGSKKSNKIKSISAYGGSTQSTVHNEKKHILIPPGASKTVTEFNITSVIYRDCDLYLYPNKKNIKKIDFDYKTSPLKFTNVITYSIGDKPNVRLNNAFYIKSVSNYTERMVKNYYEEKLCEDEQGLRVYTFDQVYSDQFYIKYNEASFRLYLKH